MLVSREEIENGKRLAAEPLPVEPAALARRAAELQLLTKRLLRERRVLLHRVWVEHAHRKAAREEG